MFLRDTALPHLLHLVDQHRRVFLGLQGIQTVQRFRGLQWLQVDRGIRGRQAAPCCQQGPCLPEVRQNRDRQVLRETLLDQEIQFGLQDFHTQ